MAMIDEVLPAWRHGERHRMAIDAPRAAVMRAVEEVTWGEAPLFRGLMTLASLGRARPPADASILDRLTARGFAAGGGFAVVGRRPDEVVVGVLAPYSLRGITPLEGEPLEEYARFDRPGYRAAMNFHFADGILTTETRVQPTDPRSSRIFRLYWLVVRPFSGLTRRAWLRGIQKRALAG
ncbi:hypothetical protein C1I98_18920 [Spongiactinospora gelatinilytica]|uniref:DUF1990 domain-containing protein n=1 Tax=Spongiactinospora gelatinilytica TaxID=2666298 RepID=A0A2W2FZM0_9ACTN|nr:hypothetical protein [Spongiactinospora gelatinilytica]PZG43086.1 hypothetical protein C1I98_18920 [Spongiactinospora gelatinilytica]